MIRTYDLDPKDQAIYERVIDDIVEESARRTVLLDGIRNAGSPGLCSTPQPGPWERMCLLCLDMMETSQLETLYRHFGCDIQYKEVSPWES